MSKSLGYILIGLILLIEIPRFFGAYDGIDPRLLDIPLTALGTGIVLPVAAGYILNTWWKTAYNKTGRNVLLYWFGVLLLMEGIILIPWGMSRLQSEPLAAVVGRGLLAWGWISVVMLSPFVCVGGTVTAISLKKDATQMQSDAIPDAKRKPKKATMTKAAQVRAFATEHPDWTKQQLAQAAGCHASTVTRSLDMGTGDTRHD